jgi:transcriptional regulator
MKIKLENVLVNDLDQVIKNEAGEDLKVKHVVARAIANIHEDMTDFFKKVEAYETFKKIKHGEGDIELSSHEIDVITNAVGKMFGVIICGQIKDAIDGLKKA